MHYFKKLIIKLTNQKEFLNKQIMVWITNYQHITPRDYYRQLYFEVLDILLSEIQQQLNQTSLSILSEMEDVIISASNGTLK